MIAVDFHEFDFSSLVKVFESEKVILVYLLLSHVDNSLSIFRIETEPSCLFWVDHGVLREHRELNFLEGCESSLCCLVDLVLIVDLREVGAV